MPDIFVSYSRADEAIARQFADRFIEAGLDVWWDSHLRSGEDWDRVIEDALRTAKAVVVLWSPEAVESRWVRAEATVAQRLGSIVPAIVRPCDLPIVFEMVQTADLSSWTGDASDPDWRAYISDVAAKAGKTIAQDVRSRAQSNVSQSTLTPGGERRRVTALSCSVELPASAVEDPEDRIDLVQSIHQALQTSVKPFGGHIIEGPTENFTALFGMYRTKEDDAVNAVEAALACAKSIAEMAQEAGHGELTLRAGLRTGTVIVEGEGSKPLGGAIDEAQRLEVRAQPGDILVCPVTANLVEGYFPLSQTDAGSMRVDGPHAAETRFELSQTRGLTGFVGREAEFELLDKAREQAALGEGQVVGVMAEAGSGKSRLCYEFKQQCHQSGMRIIESSARSNAGDVPLLAILELFRSFFGLTGSETAEEARQKIAQWVAEHDPKLDSALALLFEFLSIADGEAPPSGLDPQVRQRQLVAMLRHLISLTSVEQPTLVIVEDLHWMDDSSAQFLEQMVEAHSSATALLLLNYRPEFRAAWMQSSHCQQIALKPLGEKDVGALLVNLVGDHASVEPLHSPIMERTKGNPFFVEEVVRTLAETGQLEGEKGSYKFAGNVDALGVPDTVKAVLTARMDRLPASHKSVLQAASVIGKDFDETTLAQICDVELVELGEALANLQRTEFIQETDIFPVNRFTFRHPLTVETALGNLLRKRRRELHANIATLLEQSEASQLDEQAALIAHHWEEGNEAGKAARWYARAATWIAASDHVAAQSNWMKVRKLVGSDPQDEESIGLAVGANAQLLNLNFRINVDLELGRQMLAEGEALANLIGDEMLKLQQSILFSRILCGAGDLPGYLDAARSNLEAAKQTGEDGMILAARIMEIDASNYACLYELVCDLADSGMAEYPSDLPPEAWPTGFNPYTFFTFMKASVKGWGGNFDEAFPLLDQTEEMATRDGTPEVLCWALYTRVVMAVTVGDRALAEMTLAELRELTESAGNPLNMAHLWLAEAEFAILTENFDLAISAAESATGFFNRLERQWGSYPLMLHARALLGKGAWDDAVKMGHKAFETAEATTMPHYAIASLIVCSLAQLRQGGGEGLKAAQADLENAERRMAGCEAKIYQRALERARTEFDEVAAAA